MIFKVTARRSGDSAVFLVKAPSTKEALQSARVEANNVFDYHAGASAGPPPTVAVVLVDTDEEE